MFGANNMVKAGLVECAMALGFEQMASGSLKSHWPDRPSPSLIIGAASAEAEEELPSGDNFGPVAPRMFANAAQEYFDKYGGSVEHLAKIGPSPFVVLLDDPVCLSSVRRHSRQEPQTLRKQSLCAVP